MVQHPIQARAGDDRISENIPPIASVGFHETDMKDGLVKSLYLYYFTIF